MLDENKVRAIVSKGCEAGQPYAGKKIVSIEPFKGGDILLSEWDENKVYAGTLNAHADDFNRINDEVMRTGNEFSAEEVCVLADGTKGIFLSKKIPS